MKIFDDEKQLSAIRSYLGQYLIENNIIEQDRDQSIHCPFPGHPDKKPSAKYYRYDRDSGAFHPNIYCPVCDRAEDLLGLYQLDNNVDFATAKKELMTRYNIDPEKPNPAPNSEPKSAGGSPDRKLNIDDVPIVVTAEITENVSRLPDHDYLRNKGISDETAKRLYVGYDSQGRICFPTSGTGYFTRNLATDKDDRSFYKPRNTISEPFNLVALNQSEPVFIVEGATDVLSLYEVGADALALVGTASSRLLEWLQAYKENGLELPPLILSLDNDEAGRKGQKVLADKLKEQDIYFTEFNVSGGNKDPNDALLADRGDFASKVSNAVNVTKDEKCQIEIKNNHLTKNATGRWDEFWRRREINRNTPAIRTGFPDLDRALNGGFREGLSVIGAISSLGKTSFVLQVADNIAASGRDVVFVSLEMSANELMAKSISRETAIMADEKSDPSTNRTIFDRFKNAMTTNGVLYPAPQIIDNYGNVIGGDNDELMKEAAERFMARSGSNIYYIEADGDFNVQTVRQIIDKHLQETGRTPFVIVDYLQLLAKLEEDNGQQSDKMAVDRIVSELKRISRDYATHVMAISSFNRASYRSRVDLESFKESGGIEYSADLVLGLEPYALQTITADGKAESKRQAATLEFRGMDIRDIRLTILKNRNGAANTKGLPFTFYAPYNLFEEGLSEDNNAVTETTN